MGRVRVFLAAWLAFARSAYAHPPPEIWNVVASDDDDVILTTTRGTLFGNRTTGSWRWLCVEGFDESATDLYGMAELPSGRLIATAQDHLQTSDDRGCTWNTLSTLDATPTYLVQAPDARERVYVGAYGGVQRTVDEGKTFQELLRVDDSAHVGSLLVSSSAPRHLYATVIAPDAGVTLQHSSDDGVSWTESAVTLNAGELDLTLLAVDSTAPLQLVARASIAEPIDGERLLFSSDGGKTFTSPVSMRAMRAALFSDDGRRLWVAGRDGILAAQLGGSALQFSPVSTATRISTLLEVDGQLLAGGYYQGDDVGMNGVGYAPLDGADLTGHVLASWMDFYQVTSPLACPADTRVAQICGPLFIDYEVENPPPLPARDAGPTATADAGIPMDASGAEQDAALGPRHDSGGGCALGAIAHRSDLWALLLAALALRRRLRSRPARS